MLQLTRLLNLLKTINRQKHPILHWLLLAGTLVQLLLLLQDAYYYMINLIY